MSLFAYLLQSATRAKDRTEKAVTLGLEALPSVPELSTAVTTKESDENLHKCACTDFIACGSCSRLTDELCQSAGTRSDTCVVLGVAKLQQSSSKAAAKPQQQQQSSKAAAKQNSSKVAAKQNSSNKAAAKQSSSKAKQQQSSSKAAAKQQQSSNTATAPAALQQHPSSTAAAPQQLRSSKAILE